MAYELSMHEHEFSGSVKWSKVSCYVLYCFIKINNCEHNAIYFLNIFIDQTSLYICDGDYVIEDISLVYLILV